MSKIVVHSLMSRPALPMPDHHAVFWDCMVEAGGREYFVTVTRSVTRADLGGLETTTIQVMGRGLDSSTVKAIAHAVLVSLMAT